MSAVTVRLDDKTSAQLDRIVEYQRQRLAEHGHWDGVGAITRSSVLRLTINELHRVTEALETYGEPGRR